MRDVFRKRGGNGQDIDERRREAREDVVGGQALIGGNVFPLKNWSPNGFCIGPTALMPKPGDRLDVEFTIPLADRTLSFRCRTGVMRVDTVNLEVGGVFFNLPDEVQAVVDAHFEIAAPKDYGTGLFERLRANLARR